MDHLTTSVVTVLTAIIGVALLSVLVSRNNNTTGVISAAGSAFSGALATAMGSQGNGIVNVANNSLFNSNGITL